MKATIFTALIFTITIPCLAQDEVCTDCIQELVNESVAEYQRAPAVRMASYSQPSSRPVCPICGSPDCWRVQSVSQPQYATQMSAKELRAYNRELRREEARERISTLGVIGLVVSVLFGMCGGN